MRPRHAPRRSGRTALVLIVPIALVGLVAAGYLYYEASLVEPGPPVAPTAPEDPSDTPAGVDRIPPTEDAIPDGPPPVTYRGEVADALGDPIAGATVTPSPPPEDPAPIVRTDESGAFEIGLPPDRPPVVTIEAPGHPRRTIELETDPPIPYTLYRGGTIRGTVMGRTIGDDGAVSEPAPVPDAMLEVAGLEGWMVETSADAAGRYEMTAPVGPVVVTVRSRRHADLRVLDIEVERDETITRTISLGPGITLDVAVLGDGQPLVGAEVRAITDLGEEGAGTTNPVGRIEFHGLTPGRGTLVIVRPGYRAETHAVKLAIEDAGIAMRLRQQVPLEPAVRWDLTVVDAAGEPVPDAEVRIREGRLELLRAPVSDTAGLQVLGPDRTYSVEVSAPDRPRVTVRHRITTEPDLRVVLPRGGRFTGRVVDDRDRAVSTADILIVPVGGPSAQQGAPRLVRARLDGTFRSELLVPGPYRVQVTDSRLGRVAADAAIEDGSDSALGDMRLAPRED